MGKGTFTGQGRYTTYVLRDVGKSVEQEQQHWPSEELAEASNTKKINSLFPPDQNPHIGAQRGARSSLMEECRTRVVAGSEEEEEQEHLSSAGQVFEIRTPTKELEREARSHHWMKSRVLQHHQIHHKMSIRILHFRSHRTTSMLTPMFGLYHTVTLPLSMQKRSLRTTSTMTPVLDL